MLKKSIKVAIVLAMVIMMVSVLTGDTIAMTISGAKDTKFSGAQDTSGAASSLNTLIGAAITIVQVVGSGVAVVMLIVLAIKYISAAPSDKAEIKKHAVVYVVGAIVLFAASGILGIVKQFSNSVKASNE
ncbi:MAG: hypothetical protein IKN74_05280 [Clostridia bacterium]|nr:hypothetical protein [Clostridia bacterium]